MTDFGNVDGEVPDLATVKFSGQAIVDRALLRGERVAFTIIGEVTGLGFQTKHGALVRVHSVAIETAAEPTDELLTDVTDFLQQVDDAREGRTALPLDEDEGEE
jgi:hypothetical protein